MSRLETNKFTSQMYKSSLNMIKKTKCILMTLRYFNLSLRATFTLEIIEVPLRKAIPKIWLKKTSTKKMILKTMFQ